MSLEGHVDELGIELSRVGDEQDLTFSQEHATLSEWPDRNTLLAAVLAGRLVVGTPGGQLALELPSEALGQEV